MRGQLRELGSYFLEGHSDSLSENNEGDPAKHRPLVAALAAAAAIGGDQPSFFIEPQGGCGNPASSCNLANEHASTIHLPGLDFKFT
jgi:hypothetical protein